MHVHGLGNAHLVRVGLRHGRSRTHWERSPGYAKRVDSERVAQIFSSAHECVGFAVSSTPDFCQVRVMKRSIPSAPQLFSMALSVIIVLYVCVGILAAAGSIFISQKLFSAKAEQIFFALFFIAIAAFYLAFTAYFGDQGAWRLETEAVI